MVTTIRAAEITDAAEIARIHVDTWRTAYSGIVPDSFLSGLSIERRTADWHNQLLQGNAVILAAAHGPALVGFACGGAIREPLDEYDAELYAVYLQSDAQGQGVGRALCQALARRLQAKGFHHMLLWVLEANPAVSFYQRIGGVRVAQKTVEIGGRTLPELAFGWPGLDELARSTR
jgi:ribosomal protein S18 acetylase RimI-like enzyme